jgi:hypothetical protein
LYKISGHPGLAEKIAFDFNLIEIQQIAMHGRVLV